ncbi:MAG: GNAT family N-acetyltransferase [Oscillospiraceae bacterium]|nr:GNAT family N-acetyltransferase [Oscillospiraceae bacterium]
MMHDSLKQLRLVPLREQPALLETAVVWFSSKWGIPAAAYRESMTACLAGGVIPQWYMLLDEQDAIVGGAGVIENDFHDRPDLAPNLCAVFVEPAWRCRGCAGWLLNAIRADMASRGVHTLYLVTDHTAFYERYGWRFLTVVNGDDGSPTRLYTAYTP